MPERRAIGFFLFVACALLGALALTQRPTESARADTKGSLPNSAHANEAKAPPSERPATELSSVSKPAEPRPTLSAVATRKSAGASTRLATIRFESRSFATSEKAVAAVFIVRRTNSVRGRAAVRWAARSGSADAGIDFSDASGTVRFADGQRERAIYVPLRNDLLKEDDETFKVCLRSVGQARIGGAPCAEATIRDDDSISST